MRSKFKSVGMVSVSELLLDQNNYRLGPLDSQMECIEMMIEEFGPKMIKLAEHIAQYGLSPRPIIVQKDDKKRLVVLDGNRRITALKLLNNPSLAPDRFKKIFQNIYKGATDGLIPDEVECLTADKETIAEYRKIEHLGLQGGVGQLSWGAREKDYLQADIDGELQYALAMKICDYLFKKGVQEAKKVSISNMQRLFQDTEVGKRIGLRWDGNDFSFTAKEDEVTEVLKTIVLDFTSGKNKKVVADIYHPENRKDYIDELFNIRGIKEPSPIPKQSPPSQKKPSDNSDQQSAPKIPTRVTAPWDRKRLIKRNYGIRVPEIETKLNTVLFELASKIDVREATIAAAVLVRIVLERSVEYYIENKLPTYTEQKLYKRVRKVAEHMKQANVINDKQKEQLEKMSNSEHLISAHTLNAWIHNPDYSPTPREVCTFWDNIYFFLLKCWK